MVFFQQLSCLKENLDSFIAALSIADIGMLLLTVIQFPGGRTCCNKTLLSVLFSIQCTPADKLSFQCVAAAVLSRLA